MTFNKIAISAQVDINAPINEVWECLVSFDDYPQWNPFIRKVRGKFKEGQTLFMRLQIPAGPPLLIWPKILDIKPTLEFCWLGSLVIPGLFDGNHKFLLESLGEGKTRLIQNEVASGILLPIIGNPLCNGAKRGFEAMNNAMKNRLEDV